MTQINTIQIMMPFKLGSVNCYLIKNDSNYILIDTGSSNQRIALEKELESAGCEPGKLALIILTHGDFDHTGNAVYLREKYKAQIVMHVDDLGMVENGDMFFNRQQPNILIRKIIPVFLGFGKSKRFTPDYFVGEGDDFSAHKFNAKVISLPGHSKGSIGILLSGGELFCGDLFENLKGPSLNSIMDDVDTANSSVEKLKNHKIGTVYPGHGKPFLMEQYSKAN
jgi:glyoxylase-like metal-dependent hydrolase (beta-lactamase superfamily II)